MINYLASVVNFDLVTGPYITGSYLTYQIESQLGRCTWQANDIDIVCRSEASIAELDKLLSPISVDIQRTTRSNKFQQLNSRGQTKITWTVNNCQVQAVVHDATAADRIRWVDYSVCAIATDGKYTIMNNNTLKDIIHKTLRVTGQLEGFAGQHSLIRERYFKYTNRGYSDTDQEILKALDKIPRNV